jgi:hypothetical protein
MALHHSFEDFEDFDQTLKVEVTWNASRFLPNPPDLILRRILPSLSDPRSHQDCSELNMLEGTVEPGSGSIKGNHSGV